MSNAIQMDYDFDAIGNLESRANNWQGLWEQFDYDDLNRVETITTHAGSGSLSKTPVVNRLRVRRR